MPYVTPQEATERLARAVEAARPTILGAIHDELFPGTRRPAVVTAEELAKHVRAGIEPEELVDLWRVLFPKDRNVHYDVDEGTISFNEYLIGYENIDSL